MGGDSDVNTIRTEKVEIINDKKHVKGMMILKISAGLLPKSGG